MRMRLRVLSDYGSMEKIITEDATPAIIEETMQGLDWQGFHQVVLEQRNCDWIDVGGSLNPDDGLSVMYEEAGSQHVIKAPPTTVEEMTQFLLDYLAGGDGWKSRGEWS